LQLINIIYLTHTRYTISPYLSKDLHREFARGKIYKQYLLNIDTLHLQMTMLVA